MSNISIKMKSIAMSTIGMGMALVASSVLAVISPTASMAASGDNYTSIVSECLAPAGCSFATTLSLSRTTAVSDTVSIGAQFDFHGFIGVGGSADFVRSESGGSVLTFGRQYQFDFGDKYRCNFPEVGRVYLFEDDRPVSPFHNDESLIESEDIMVTYSNSSSFQEEAAKWKCSEIEDKNFQIPNESEISALSRVEICTTPTCVETPSIGLSGDLSEGIGGGGTAIFLATGSITSSGPVAGQRTVASFQKRYTFRKGDRYVCFEPEVGQEVSSVNLSGVVNATTCEIVTGENSCSVTRLPNPVGETDQVFDQGRYVWVENTNNTRANPVTKWVIYGQEGCWAIRPLAPSNQQGSSGWWAGLCGPGRSENPQSLFYNDPITGEPNTYTSGNKCHVLAT